MWFPRVLDSELLRACGAQLHTHNPPRIYLRMATPCVIPQQRRGNGAAERGYLGLPSRQAAGAAPESANQDYSFVLYFDKEGCPARDSVVSAAGKLVGKP